LKNNREIGSEFEDAAAAYLESKGYVILERNFGDRKGEIDIIAKDGKELVFIEVKYRRNLEKGDAAKRYLYRCHLGEDIPCRFDVVAILGQEIRLIKDAF